MNLVLDKLPGKVCMCYFNDDSTSSKLVGNVGQVITGVYCIPKSEFGINVEKCVLVAHEYRI